MLLTYAVENYKGIATKQTINFIATQKNEFEQHLVNITSALRVNTGACIVGANGTGKTHLLESLNRLSDFVGQSPRNLKVEPFILDYDSKDKPTTFEVLLYSESLKELLSYSLSIFKQEVVSESLYAKSLEKGAQSRKIFERNDSGVKFNSKFKSSETLVNSTVDSGSTLISYAKGLKVQQLKETYDILRGIFMFSPMQVKAIGPEFINFLLFRDGKVNSENQDKLSKLRNDLLDFSVLLLKSYDIPISDIEIKTKESGENYLIITPKTLNDNVLNLTFSEARDYYSEGTFNTILLVILISLMSNGKRILLLDEIDGSLHHRLSLELIKMMRNSHKDINTQFILSTHDIMLLDNEFRRDSIFITSKDDKLETIISRVSDFSLRKDAKISAKYLADEFGALPKILTDESEKILSEISEFSMESSEND